MNIKKQYSTRSLGTPTIFSGQKTFYYKNNQWYYGGDDNPVIINSGEGASNVEPENQPGLINPSNFADFNKNLQILNGRLNAVHKELTYWDLYRISASVNSKEEFYSVFASLAIGQSMVINCNTFALGGISYHRGDVIVKINENSEVKIDSIATGIYFPYWLESSENNTDTYNIHYKYTSAVPLASGAKVENNQVTGETPNTELTFNIEPSFATDNIIYGIVSSNDPCTFTPVKDSQNQIIKPVIKIFDQYNEEIIVDLKGCITITPTEISIRDWHQGPANTIQVK